MELIDHPRFSFGLNQSSKRKEQGLTKSKSQLRLTGGPWKGRPLVGGIPKGVRPTSSRVREAICSIVLSKIKGARVLDAFGGAGTMALEFRSRGAQVVLSLEKSALAMKAITRSFHSFEDPQGLIIEHRDTLRFLEQGPTSDEDLFDLVLLDPPYKTDLGERTIELLSLKGWLNKDAVVLLEADSRKDAPQSPSDLAFRSSRRYGDTTLYIFDYCG